MNSEIRASIKTAQIRSLHPEKNRFQIIVHKSFFSHLKSRKLKATGIEMRTSQSSAVFAILISTAGNSMSLKFSHGFLKLVAARQ